MNSLLATVRTVPGLSPRTLALGAAALALVVAFPELSLGAVRFAALQLALVSPMILLGVALTAGVVASGATAMIAAAFAGREGRMIAVAALVGTLTPVCGITVLPLVAGLLAARVPLAPIMAFWLSSPVMGPGMVAITLGTLGPGFALAKGLGAFGIGLLGGFATLALTRRGVFAEPVRDWSRLTGLAGQGCGGCGGPEGLRLAFWREPARRAAFRASARATGRLMLVWLSLAFLAEFFLRAWLPSELIVALVGEGRGWAVPLAALVGAPIYLDGYAALPLVRGLIENGMRPDAALSFLIAGGIVSAWAAIPVYALVRLPVFLAYLAFAVAGSMLAGWAYGLALG